MFLDGVRFGYCYLFKCMIVFVYFLLIKLNVQLCLFLLIGEDDYEGYDINRLRKFVDMTRMDKLIMVVYSRFFKCKLGKFKWEL